MKRFNKVLIVFFGILLILSFQNCSSDNSKDSSNAGAGTIEDTGSKIQFEIPQF